jgi:hypothetical protein
MKNCVRCNLTKDENEFYKDSSRKDGFSNRCKECDRKHHQKYINDYPDYKKAQLEKIVKWSQKNKEAVAIAKKKWRAENRDRINEIQRNWRKNNPEKVIAQRLRDSLKNKDSVVL